MNDYLTTTTRATRASRTSSTATVQPSFNFESGGASPAMAILGLLSTQNGWHAKESDVLAATSITDGQWSASIVDLMATGKVERQGERRGTRYRVVEVNSSFGDDI